jgi:hypothetical protein
MSFTYMRSALLFMVILLGIGGCNSSGYSTSVGVGMSSGYYHGGGWYDPYHYRPCCRGGVVVRPPPNYRPPSYRPPSGGGRPVNLPSMARPSRR